MTSSVATSQGTAPQNHTVKPDSKSAELLPIDMAIAKGLGLVDPVGEYENISLLEARDRVCFKTVYTELPLPNFNNSAMDGYALNTESLSKNGPYRLRINGRMAAGDRPDADRNILAVDAIRILTGALVPDAYNAVIMQEKCIIDGGNVYFDHAPPKGNNIRWQGEDCVSGSVAVNRGTRIKANHASLLAAQGHAGLSVFRKVRVAFFSTGSELRQPGEALAQGQIYNSNRFVLAMQLALPFIELMDFGTIPDDPAQLKKVLKQASTNADIIITTGGVSVGDEDHMPRLVTELGGKLHVMKVAIKPGKPVTIGTIGSAIYVGLPGNPVAAFINQVLIAKPIIEKLAGLHPQPPASQTVIAGFSRNSSVSRQEYVLGRIVEKSLDGVAVVEAFDKSGSATMMPLAHSDGFIVVPMGTSEVNPGDHLQFISHC